MDTSNFLNILKEQFEKADFMVKGEEVGRVISVADGIAQIEGLRKVMFSEMVLIERQFEKKFVSFPALILSLEEYSCAAVLLAGQDEVREGDLVKRTKNILSVPVGEKLLGRVINPLGEPIDGKGALSADPLPTLPIERSAPSVISRESVNTPLATGIKVIDAVIPIGRGQRELIIGDRQIGKTALVKDAIINQITEPKEKRPFCVYVAIGQKASKTAKLVEELKKTGALDYTIVVAAEASDPASLWYIAPYAGCTIAEYFRDKGKDALIIYDDLSKHAQAWRQIALLLKRAPGREAYPGDIFYLHSRLLERAAKLSPKYGGGSLTALPIVETQANDIASYIPTNVISITDGQIFLEPDLFAKGQRPAVNIGLSVSRVGSAAQTKAMKKVAGQLKLELAQYQELAAFVQFAQDLDDNTKKRIARGARLTELLKQDEGSPLPFEEQVISLYSGVSGALDLVPLERVRDYETKILEHFRDRHSEILKEIRETADFSDVLQNKTKKIIEEFTKNFV
jgi:F-type H+-transporting ATPase subunit alpha